MPETRLLGDLRREAFDATRGLFEGEQALVAALAGISEERNRAAEAYAAIVRSLAVALSARDGYTGEHSDTVRELAVAVGRSLGLDGRLLAEVEACALLHDVGKIGVPDAILHKAGSLDPEEWAVMREHPIIGERILRPLPGLSEVATAVRHEHERWDGEGYPDGLAGEEIPIASRIVFVCDAFNALVSDRPYRSALSIAAAIAELERCAATQFDPIVVAALLTCLQVNGSVASAAEADLAELLSPPESDGDGRRLERELRALITIASAVAAVEDIDDLVELAAEEARQAIDADTLSISRWEADALVLRVIVNTGDLANGEVRRPNDETYRLDEDDALRVLLVDGCSYTTSLDDPQAFVAEAELLAKIGKHSCAAVPIMLGGSAWGELWASRGAEMKNFGERDVRFLETIAGQVAAAVGRTELYARMADLAFRDPLTGVGNRRALEERLELSAREAIEHGGDVAVLLGDLDNLKELNDALGHARGDQALAAVAGALSAEVLDLESGDRTVYRLGGDEFCLLLVGGTAEDAHAAGERVIERLRSGPEPTVSASFGVSSIGRGAGRPSDLLRAADHALYVAKRTGRSCVCVADADHDAVWASPVEVRMKPRRRVRAGGAIDAAALLSRSLEDLDGELSVTGPFQRLQAIVAHICGAVDAARASISFEAAGSGTISTYWTVNLRAGRTWTKGAGPGADEYASSDYPQTAKILRTGGSFLLRADDLEGDPAEIDLLESFGMSALLAAAAPADGGSWLVEVYSDGVPTMLEAAEATSRLLVAEAVRRRAVLAPARRAAVA